MDEPKQTNSGDGGDDETIDSSRAELPLSDSNAFSDTSSRGRFVPGTKVGDRYRIVSLSGEGGMGEVYRADDLKLGHPVALKFLPRHVSDNPDRLELMHNEVRLTRQISHPNVCRVYDIGEVDGRHFLSMEYIDGEDLKVLLRRIGRLPHDKGVEIARQLCAGLAAAHERGVLHRDLKPANIMIDGRGQVRITDFGVATLAEKGNEGRVVGTPAYMSPEQFMQGEATIQSDLYSLGLILYEVFTGKHVHKSVKVQDLRQWHQQSTSISQPSTVIQDVDPVVDRVIMRCLDRHASDRPKSALEVAAALPGGDPLAAVLAAGETPSPAMVAAAGEKGFLSFKVAGAVLTGVFVALLAVAWLAEWTYSVNLEDLPYEPAVLAVKAREMITENLGYDQKPVDVAKGFHGNRPERFYGNTTDGSEFLYGYRESFGAPFIVQELWSSWGELSWARPTFEVPSWRFPGQLGLLLRPDGHLHYFRSKPALESFKTGDQLGPENLPWSKWFPVKATGLNLNASTGGAPENGIPMRVIEGQGRTPPDAFDALRVWQGDHPAYGGEFYAIAAAFRGHPVYFEVLGAKQYASLVPDPDMKPTKGEYGQRITLIIYQILIIVGAVLAWRNVRSGRGDRRGALRLAFFVFLLGILIWLLRGRHLIGPEQTAHIIIGLVQSFWHAGLLWLFYVALEPMVRRTWPQVLISWSRLMDGRLTDPIVGRELLIGSLGGVFSSILFQLGRLSDQWSSGQLTSQAQHLLALDGTLEMLSVAIQAPYTALFVSFFTLLLLLLCRLLFHSERRAAGATWVIFSCLLVLLYGFNAMIAWLPIGLHVAISLCMMIRFGLLAHATYFTVRFLTSTLPLTLYPDRWYFGYGMVAIVIVIGISFYGFRFAVGGQRHWVSKVG